LRSLAPLCLFGSPLIILYSFPAMFHRLWQCITSIVVPSNPENITNMVSPMLMSTEVDLRGCSNTNELKQHFAGKKHRISIGEYEEEEDQAKESKKHRATPSPLPEPSSQMPTVSTSATEDASTTGSTEGSVVAGATEVATKKRPPPPAPTRRRQRGAERALQELAGHITSQKKVVFITGAGLSVASGIRPFRSNPKAELPAGMKQNKHTLQAGLWNEVVWTMATRESFRKDPTKFYNDFWIPHFISDMEHYPNEGHDALHTLMNRFGNIKQITQNIDGLQKPREDQMVEVHGRAGLFKCCPDDDSDDEEDADDDHDDAVGSRPVQLGHRRKSQQKRERVINSCPYQYNQSLKPEQLVLRDERLQARGKLNHAPRCPACGNHVMPQALLFDEGYHSHSFYQFEVVENWMQEADVMVFVGTSLGSVRLTRVALEHAREKQIPVCSFNMFDASESTS